MLIQFKRIVRPLGISVTLLSFLLVTQGVAKKLPNHKDKKKSEAISATAAVAAPAPAPMVVSNGSNLVTPQGYLLANNTVLFGILAGYNTSDLNGYISGPFGVDSNSRSHGYPTIGFQAEVLFNGQNYLNPYFSFNATSPMSRSENKIVGTLVSPLTTANSELSVNNTWVVRALVGLETKPFIYDMFSLGAGFGLAVVNPVLLTTINDSTHTKNSNKITSVQPSVAANLKWFFCSACIGGQGGALELQVAGDRYPTMNQTTTTPSGSYLSHVNRSWQTSTALIFNVAFK